MRQESHRNRQENERVGQHNHLEDEFLFWALKGLASSDDRQCNDRQAKIVFAFCFA
jgi:hypothetical protein